MSRPILGTDATGRACPINLDRLIETRLVLAAISGGGKSHALRRILEQTHGHVQHIVIDPEGEFFTLRERFPYILAGRNGDCPAEVKSAGLLATRLLELRVSAIVDLYALTADPRNPNSRTHFVKAFLDSLLNAPQHLFHPCLVVIDEAHKFAPEKGEGEAISGGSVINLMADGRKKLLCGLLASQRISKLDKSAIAEAHNMMIGKSTLDVDVTRAMKNLGFRQGQETTIRHMQRGHFWTYGPAISDEVVDILVGDTQTSSPKFGARLTKPAPPSQEIAGILGKLADIPEEAEKRLVTEAELRAECTSLRKELAAIKRATIAPTLPLKLVATEDKLKARFEKGVTAERRRISAELSKALRLAEKELAKVLPIAITVKTGENEFNYAYPTIPLDNVRAAIAALDRTAPMPAVEEVPQLIDSRPATPVSREPFQPMTGRHAQNIAASNGELSGPARKILAALSQLEALRFPKAPRTLVALMVGYTNTASTGFAKAVSHLSATGNISYPNSNEMALTDAGRQLCPEVDAPMTAQDLHRQTLDLLGGKKAEMLKLVLEAYPEAMSKDDLMRATGYSNEASTGFVKALSALSGFGLVEYPQRGFVRAKDFLWLK
jgi:uncharacterized protein